MYKLRSEGEMMNFKFEPKEDITAYELAKILADMPILTNKNVLEHLDNEGVSLYRHFTKITK